MKEILTWYRYERCGTPWVVDAYSGEHESRDVAVEINERVWNEELDKMIALLDKMNTDEVQITAEALKAKDEFFKMFSEYFYDFWD